MDAVAANAAFSQFMESLFVSRTLFFVGASLEGIEGYLQGIRFRGQLSRRNYALVGVAGNAWRPRAEAIKRRYGIEVLPFPAGEETRDVHDFLEELHKRVAEARGTREPPDAEHAPRDPAYLTYLQLVQVGPFKNLEMHLDRHWNILLGDNGVGKSNILRAVAAALCGRDAQGHADRLIRYGAPGAQVTIGLNNDKQYVTELLRTSTEPEIKSLPARPLDVEGWLALGFPALRTVTWRRTGGPQLDESRKRSVPADVLPLIVGDPDPRMDELKQWIVNIDYRSKHGNSGWGNRYGRLLEEFFRIVGRIAGRLRVEFGGVDVERGRVLVITDDGEVPIEAVSQGTVSLLGWIGVLLQRMYEVYDRDDNPSQRYALVLIDEIDAHLHPEWQQSLVPTLSELFPNVQFIATTHSPLVVGGMPVKQITRFSRDEEGRAVRVELGEEETVGRADQVLTSRLFGMETTRDKRTQEQIGRYQALLGKDSRSVKEEEQFRELQKDLQFRVSVPQEGPVERRAQELLLALMRSQIGGDEPEAQEALMAKANRLFTALNERKGRLA